MADMDQEFLRKLQSRLGMAPKQESAGIEESWVALQRSIVAAVGVVEELPEGAPKKAVQEAVEAVMDLVEAHEGALEAAGVIEPGDVLLEPEEEPEDEA